MPLDLTPEEFALEVYAGSYFEFVVGVETYNTVTKVTTIPDVSDDSFVFTVKKTREPSDPLLHTWPSAVSDGPAGEATCTVPRADSLAMSSNKDERYQYQVERVLNDGTAEGDRQVIMSGPLTIHPAVHAPVEAP